jgi:hypothetical protein
VRLPTPAIAKVRHNPWLLLALRHLEPDEIQQPQGKNPGASFGLESRVAPGATGSLWTWLHYTTWAQGIKIGQDSRDSRRILAGWVFSWTTTPGNAAAHAHNNARHE